MSRYGNRREVSVVTFGLVGRLVITAFMVNVAVYLVLFANPGFLIALAMWVFVVMPKVLRDVWRRAELPETDLSRLEEQSRREAQQPEKAQHLAFGDAPPPRRW